MESITIGEIASILAFLVGIIGSIEFLIIRLKKVFNKAIEPLNNRLNDIELSTDKNFLVRFLADIEQNNPIDDVEKERFYETYERYKKLGGNSYISHKVEKLEKEEKL